MPLNINALANSIKWVTMGKLLKMFIHSCSKIQIQKDHLYYFDVSNSDIKIDKPSEPFLLSAGEKVKKWLSLCQYQKNLRLKVKIYLFILKLCHWCKRKNCCRTPHHLLFIRRKVIFRFLNRHFQKDNILYALLLICTLFY